MFTTPLDYFYGVLMILIFYLASVRLCQYIFQRSHKNGLEPCFFDVFICLCPAFNTFFGAIVMIINLSEIITNKDN